MDLNSTFELSPLSDEIFLVDYKEWLDKRIKPHMDVSNLASIGAEILLFIADQKLITQNECHECRLCEGDY